jgi:hypothetical protein
MAAAAAVPMKMRLLKAISLSLCELAGF